MTEHITLGNAEHAYIPLTNRPTPSWYTRRPLGTNRNGDTVSSHHYIPFVSTHTLETNMLARRLPVAARQETALFSFLRLHRGVVYGDHLRRLLFCGGWRLRARVEAAARVPEKDAQRALDTAGRPGVPAGIITRCLSNIFSHVLHER